MSAGVDPPKSATAADVSNGGAPNSADEHPTQRAASEAVGVFCVPVLIAGRLPAADLISRSQFTRGTHLHPAPQNGTSFESRVSNGDIVEVYADERAHGCTIHIHGSATAIDDYRAALRAQNWEQVMPPEAAKSGGVSEVWRVRFQAPAGSAIQAVVTAPVGVNDPAKPQVTAIFFHVPR
jgi:hypothetical protein